MTDAIASSSLIYNMWLNGIAGSVGGVTNVLLGQPFDIVKVRMQNQCPLNPLYTSATHGAKAISLNEGNLAFYKGTLAPLMGIAIGTSVQFGLNELSKRTMASINRSRGTTDPSRLSPMQYIIGGSLAGAGNSLIATPVELIRITMQNQSSVLDPRLKFSGSFDAAKRIYQMYGARSLYSGFKITMMRDVLSYATFFGIYEILKSTTVDKDSPPNFAWLMLLGSVSGIISWFPSYAFDVGKTKIQSDSFSAPLYKGVKHVFTETYKQEGWRGFVKGLKPGLARTTGTSAVTMGVFEVTLKFLRDGFDRQKKATI